MKNKRRKIIIKALILIFLMGIIYSLFNIVLWYVGNKKNATITEELKKSIEVVSNKEEKQIEGIESNKITYQIDFKSLKEKNTDTVGYIKVNNTNIDYIVVKGKDNQYYLKHNFNKEYNLLGWVFMDYRNKLDGNDKNIIIYGHNIKSGSMFGTLKRVITKEWYTNADNYIVNLYLEGGLKKYQVFSTYSIPVEDYYITTEFKDNKEFKNFVDTLTKRSVYNYHVEVGETDHILTISTCTGNGKKRMVLHAKEIINEI